MLYQLITKIINQLRHFDNVFAMVLFPLLSVAFVEVTGMELNTESIVTIGVMAITIASSYGIENLISRIRNGYNVSGLQIIWRSKRFWWAVVGIFSTALYSAYPVDFQTTIQGNQVGFYDALLALFLSGAGLITLDDWGAVSRKNIPPKADARNDVLRNTGAYYPPDNNDPINAKSVG